MVTDPPPLVHEVHFSLPVGEKPTVPGPPPPIICSTYNYKISVKQTLKFFTVQYRSAYEHRPVGYLYNIILIYLLYVYLKVGNMSYYYEKNARASEQILTEVRSAS